MTAAAIPTEAPECVKEAAVLIGQLLQEALTAGAPTERLNRIRAALQCTLTTAAELGKVQREVAVLTRYTEKLEAANSRLTQRMSKAHAEREQFVRDLVPALDLITNVFNRAREQRDSLAPSSTPYNPPPVCVLATSIDGYREAPVEAHEGD